MSQDLLPSFDTAYLEERKTAFSVAIDGGMTCLLIPAFPLPCGYDRSESDLLLRLSPGYARLNHKVLRKGLRMTESCYIGLKKVEKNSATG